MKKTYCKPQIAFEDFELCANIAAGCEFKTDHAMDVCAYKLLGGYKVFVAETTACKYKAAGWCWRRLLPYSCGQQKHLYLVSKARKPCPYAGQGFLYPMSGGGTSWQNGDTASAE